jgi:hypothetical protein
MPRKGITVYLTRDLEAKIEKIARDQHRSESSVIAEAVRARFSGRDGDPMPPVNDPRTMNRLDARLDKVIGEGLIVKEVLLLFVRVWLEHNPPIDEALEDSAAASAEARFERFLQMVANGLRGGRALSDASALNGEGAANVTADAEAAAP